MTPSLTTTKLVLTPLRDALKINVEWMNNKDNMRFSENRHVVHTINTCRSYVRSFDHVNRHIWAIHDFVSYDYVGNITAECDPHNNIADVGILIDCNYWRKGYGKESWQSVCDWLLKTKKVRKIESGCMANNLGMKRIFETTGMTFDGERKNHFLFDHNPVGLLMYARFK